MWRNLKGYGNIIIISAEVGVLLGPAEGNAAGKISSAADFPRLQIRE